MKILEICRSMPWHLAGGLERHTWDLVRGLAARGDEVHLLTTVPFPDRLPPAPPAGIHLHALPAGRPGRYSFGVFRAFAREAERLQREIGFDAIHAQGFAAGAFPARLASRLAVTIHGTLTSETLLYPPVFRQLGLGGKMAALWRHKGRLASAPFHGRLLRMARIVLVDSQFTKRELLDGRPDLEPKIRVAPLGVHPERVPPRGAAPRKPTGDPLRLLSVGRLTEGKGMRVALEALALTPRGRWRWQVAGTGPELEPLRRRVQTLGLADCVEFLGEVDDLQLAALYSHSDLFLYPELSYPAFGLVALEALLAGLPVLASDRGAIPEVVNADCGWLVPGGDPKALAAQLQALMADPSPIADKATRCRASALQRFSFDQMIAKTRSALEECAGERGARTD